MSIIRLVQSTFLLTTIGYRDILIRYYNGGSGIDLLCIDYNGLSRRGLDRYGKLLVEGVDEI